MKKHGICENYVREIAKFYEINAIGLREMSFHIQTTSSKSFKQDCCRSLSFG